MGGEADSKAMQPLQLLQEDGDGDYILNLEPLENILKHKKLRGRSIVPICVVGAFRMGKSFLLNVMKNYLKAQGAEEWTKALISNGFSYRGGIESITKGVLLWPETFLIDKNLAVLLLDTQGLFDDESSIKENSFLFNFATLISSLQIFNISHQIQMDDMRHLQVFLELGRYATDTDSDKPFQKLIFLVRDWQNSNSFQYGLTGGQSYLQNKWLNPDRASIEKQKIQQTLSDCFNKVECCLLGYPGKKIAEGTFSDDVTQGDPEFLDSLTSFVRTILSAEFLPPKCVAGVEIKAENFANYVKKIYQCLQKNKVNIPDVMECMADAANSEVRRKGLHKYSSYMAEKLKEIVLKLSDTHNEAVISAQKVFDSRKTLGAEELKMKHHDLMMKDIKQQFSNFEKINDMRKEAEKLESQIEPQGKTPESIWKESTKLQQKYIFTLLGNRRYDIIPVSHVEKILERKVGFAIFGPPSTEDNLGYMEDENIFIEQMCDKIRNYKKNDGNVYFSAVYVFYTGLDFKETKMSPIFRILKKVGSKDEHIFIDENQKVYKDWNDYLNNNELPVCHMCFPKDGIYTCDEKGKVLIDSKKQWRKGKTSLVGLGAGGLFITGGIISFFVPPISLFLLPALFIGSAVGVMCLVYGIYLLLDNLQDINLEHFNSDSGRLSLWAGYSLLMLKQKNSLIDELFESVTTLEEMTEVVSELGFKTMLLLTLLSEFLKPEDDIKLKTHEIEKIKSCLLFYFHILVEKDVKFDSLMKGLIDIRNRCTWHPNVELDLTHCSCPEEIVEIFRKMGF